MARDDERRRRNAASRVTNYSTFGSGGVQLRGDNPTLAPEDNPAYQAAIAGGRPARNKFTNIPTPSGGSVSVPIGAEDRYSRILNKLPSAPTGFERPNAQASYALGDTGAIPTGNTPYEQSYRMGYQGEGGVQQPPPSFGFQVGNTLRNAAPGIIPFAQNAVSRVAQGIGNFFGGGRAYGTQYGENLQNQPVVPPQPMTVPAGINNLVQPPGLTGPSPNERMFPTGAGGTLPFPEANPALGTVRMANERFPGNTGAGLPSGSQYPTAIQQPAVNPALQTVQAMQQGMTPQQAIQQNQPRRYSDMYP